MKSFIDIIKENGFDMNKYLNIGYKLDQIEVLYMAKCVYGFCEGDIDSEFNPSMSIDEMYNVVTMLDSEYTFMEDYYMFDTDTF